MEQRVRTGLWGSLWVWYMNHTGERVMVITPGSRLHANPTKYHFWEEVSERTGPSPDSFQIDRPNLLG